MKTTTIREFRGNIAKLIDSDESVLITKQQGLTQYQLGALTKISTTFIGEMERGLKAPNLEAVVAIAQALRVSVQEMVSGFGTTSP